MDDHELAGLLGRAKGTRKRAAEAGRELTEQVRLENDAFEAGYLGEYFALADTDEYLADCYDRGLVLAAKIGHNVGRLFHPKDLGGQQ